LSTRNLDKQYVPSPTYILPLPKGGGGFGGKGGRGFKEKPSPTLVLPLPEGGGGFEEKREGRHSLYPPPQREGGFEEGLPTFPSFEGKD